MATKKPTQEAETKQAETKEAETRQFQTGASEPEHGKTETVDAPEARPATPESQEAEQPDEAQPEQRSTENLDELPIEPQGDDQAKVGGFVEVVDGEHKGRYGVLVEAHSLDNAVVRTRDSMNERIVTRYSDLVPSEAGHR